MNSAVVVGILQTAQGVMAMLARRDAGAPLNWEQVLVDADLSAFGLSAAEHELVQYSRLGLRYLQERKVTVQDAIVMIQSAEQEGGRVTADQVATYITQNAIELDDLQDLIDAKVAAEQ